MNPPPLPPQRVFLPWLILAAACVSLLVLGIREVVDYNDFEVFYYGANAAVERDPGLYSGRSPIKDRSFLYPPAAAVLFAPLSLLPHHASGVLWTVAKVGAVLLVLLGGACACRPAQARTSLALLALVGYLWAFRSVDNDFSNGQVNILVAVLGAVGAWLMVRDNAWKWVGAPLVAVAVAVKLTPVIFLAVPLLRRRWGTFFAAIALTALLVFALPRLWFGPELAGALQLEYRDVNAALFLHAKNDDEQVSLYQLVFFGISQVALDGSRYRYDAEEVELLEQRDGAWKEARMPDLPFDPYARALGIGIALLGGAVYLGARWRLWGLHGQPPTGWDIAVLATLMVFLSPLVRRAHTAAYMIPAVWLACWWAGQAVRAGGWKAAVKARRGAAFAFVAVALCMLAADDIPLPVPGLYPMPMHPAMFVASVLLLGLLWVAGRDLASGDYPAETLPR